MMKETYLYIKQHKLTGLKYFGKTTKIPGTKAFDNYKGGGKKWTAHIKENGIKFVVTDLAIGPYTNKEELTNLALWMSETLDVEKSEEWANLIPENGLGGCSGPHSDSSKLKMSISRKGKHHSDSSKLKMSISRKGKHHSDSSKLKMSKAHQGKPKSAEHKANLSIASKGKPKGPLSEETKAKMSLAHQGKPQEIVTCPHCGKSGGQTIMTRWHFVNCKLKQI